MTKRDKLTGGELLTLNRAGYTYSELGIKYDLTRNQIASKINQHKQKEYKRRQLFEVALTTPWTMEGDFMVTGDVHIPCTDIDFAELLIQVAKAQGLKRLIVGGDFFNLDTFSFYASVVPPPTWAQERDAARHLIKVWLKWFDEIYFLMGNHDRRMTKWANGEFDESDLFGMVTSSDKCHYSNWGWCVVNTPGQYPWRITHAKEYSVNQLTVAGELANKYQMNIISHHEHHLAHGWDKYKRYVTVNNGGLFDAEKFAYVVLDDNKRPGMTQGFTTLINGVAAVYGKYPFTDWNCI